MAISNLTTGLRPGVCTSLSRPTAPYEGQQIYETDTDKIRFWNGSIWKEIVLTNTGAATQYPPVTVNPADIGNNWYRYSQLPEVTMETGTSVAVSYQLVCSANASGKTVQIAPSVAGATTINGRDGNSAASVYLNSTGSHSAAWTRVFTGLNAGVNEFYMEIIADGGAYALTFRVAMQVFRLD